MKTATNRLTVVASVMVVAFALAGCTTPTPSDSGLAREVLATGRVPAKLLASAGLPEKHEILPFICGGASYDYEGEFADKLEKDLWTHKDVATELRDCESWLTTRPESERRQAEARVRESVVAFNAFVDTHNAEIRKTLAELRSVKIVPSPVHEPPKPEYVIDLTRAESVQVVTLGRHRLTLIGHPCAPRSPDYAITPNKHRRPPRVSVDGPMVFGVGPVTVWSGDRLMLANLHPETLWIVADCGATPGPFMFTIPDFLGIGGPIELAIYAPPREAGELTDRALGWEWLDLSATGSRFVIKPIPSSAPDYPDLLVEQSRIDAPDSQTWQDIGRFRFKAKTGNYEFEKNEGARKKP